MEFEKSPNVNVENDFSDDDSNDFSLSTGDSSTHLTAETETMEPYIRKHRKGRGSVLKRNSRKGTDEDDQQTLRLKINSRERKRMHDLNSAMDCLRSAMPYSQSPSVRKLSKIGTLLLARNYILMLNRSLEEMRRTLAENSTAVRLPPHPSTFFPFGAQPPSSLFPVASPTAQISNNSPKTERISEGNILSQVPHPLMLPGLTPAGISSVHQGQFHCLKSFAPMIPCPCPKCFASAPIPTISPFFSVLPK